MLMCADQVAEPARSTAMPEVHDLNLRHLDAIVAIARSGRLRATAAAMDMSQPALTQAVGALERQLGTRLFDRLPHAMVPTTAGYLLINRCARALAHLAAGCGIEQRPDHPLVLSSMGRRLNLRQLRAVMAIDRQGSPGFAAEEIGVRRSTIVRALRQLEAVLGIALLRVEGGMVGFTEAGDRLIHESGLAAAELRAGLEEIGEFQHGESAHLAIGTLPLPGMVLLPEAITRFAATRSTLSINVVKATYRDLLAKLRGGEIDFMLGGMRTSPLPEDLAQELLFEEELFVVAAHDHPLAGQSLDRQALARFPWVISPESSPLRAMWERLFESDELPAKRIQCGSASTIRGLLLTGQWLALLSPGQFRLERSAGLLKPIGGPISSSRHQLGIITRRDWQPTRSQKDFVDLLRSAAVGR